jgi:hypothetical protein
MPVKFPKRRADGAFCVEITLLVNTHDLEGLAARITSWMDQWTQGNRYWNCFGVVLDFFDDFVRPPICVKHTSESLILRVEGRPDSKKSWRDWIVLRLLKDLQEEFHEITAVESFANCPD